VLWNAGQVRSGQEFGFRDWSKRNEDKLVLCQPLTANR
jgi:hypothetical protein